MENTSNISFFSSYRPALPLDIFSCSHKPTPNSLEVRMTDGKFYNFKGREIPKESLKLILQNSSVPINLSTNEADVDSGRLTGLIFGSERTEGLEILHIGLRLEKESETPEFQVISFSDAFAQFNGIRLEDSGTFSGHYLVYVSTRIQPDIHKRRQPWTVVYRLNLINGLLIRITPKGEADLSPSVSPSGKKLAVASFQDKRDSKGKIVGWDGEIEDLQTDIYVMDLENPSNRHLAIKNGGWPSWGSDDILYFHRKSPKDSADGLWGVYRANVSGRVQLNITRVTPTDFDAMTPAAIDETKVVVATIRQKSGLDVVERTADQYRHIEIFDSTTGESTPVTKVIKPLTSHFDPFVLDGGNRIGYTTVNRNYREIVENLPTQVLDKVKSPLEKVGLYRTQGVFPTISKDGTKLAFVDNEFENVWLVDGEKSPRMIFQRPGRDNVFGPVWDPVKDTLYICLGPSFHPKESLQIAAIDNVSSYGEQVLRRLTVEKNIKGSDTIKTNSGFPFPNPEGTRLVFRSTREGLDHKNLYIMEDTINGENNGGKITRITNGKWTDTQPNWSPNGDWIAFASNRDKPRNSKPLDNGLDSGYFAVYLLKVANPHVVIRVMYSRDDIAGHVNHPFFSPDGNTIVVTSDVAAVSVDPISLPLLEHSVRPYGDIFAFKIDTKNIEKNPDILEYTRITHSRYENSTPIWAPHGVGDTFKNFLRLKISFGHAKCPCPPIAFLVDKAKEEKEEEKEEL